MRTLLTLAAVAGLTVGIRHFLRHRAGQHAARRRPVLGTLANKVRASAAIPESVDVSSRKGVVTLKGGPMPKEDVDRALAAALAVPGVREVRNFVQTTL